MAFGYELVPASLNLDLFWSQLGLEVGPFRVTYMVGGRSGTSTGYPGRLPGMGRPWAAGRATRKPSGRGLSLPAATKFLLRSCVCEPAKERTTGWKLA